MSTLLEQAVEAHGGLATWTKLHSASAQLDIGGVIWHAKGQPDMFKDVEVEADLREQHIAMTSQAAGWKGDFTPDLIRFESGDWFERRFAPRGSYEGHEQLTPWDRLHALYFCSYALWTYLSMPFIYTRPGFNTEELSEHEENGELWRRLKITFPDSIASHCREQISYFGEDGLLRRHDYTVDVLGGATGANYASNYQNVGGIMVPMSRRVYAYNAAGQKIDEPLLVSIDFHSLTWRTD